MKLNYEGSYLRNDKLAACREIRTLWGVRTRLAASAYLVVFAKGTAKINLSAEMSPPELSASSGNTHIIWEPP